MRVVGSVLAAGTAFLLAACASAPVAAPLAAEPPAPAIAEPAPAFSAEGLAALEARMAAYIDEGRVKGIATRLVKDGEIYSDTRTGIRREADSAPVTGDQRSSRFSRTRTIGRPSGRLWLANSS